MTPRLKPLPHLDDLNATNDPGFAPSADPIADERELTDAHDIAKRCVGMADVVTRASKTMTDLIERNKSIRADAEATIAAVANEARTHGKRASEIERELAALRQERAQLIKDGERRIRALSDETAALKDRLETAAAELASSEEWLDHLNEKISTQLESVFARADAMRATRSTDIGG